LGVVAALVFTVCAPIFKDGSLVGGHDWDQMEAHRYLIYKTITQFKQFPFWNPYGCGGHTAWGGVESGAVVISPWLPAYLFLKIQTALRVEVVGTALLSAIGTWLLAGRFTKSAAMRAFVCVAFVVNGRWALQASVGHTWHLYYAWTPWALYFFDRAIDRANPERWRDAIVTGGFIALMVYTGAIYPLPETVLILTVYALLVAGLRRALRPLLALALAGASGLGLSVLKLLPVLDTLRRFPRLIESNETLDVQTFVAIFTGDAGNGKYPPHLSQWGWHEWGIYIGWIPFLAILVGGAFARGARETALKWAGIACLLLGFGNFSEWAPWPLLRHAPIFKSQHVPSRWLYPAVLLLAVVVAAVMERALRRARGRRPLAEALLLGLVAYLAVDIAGEARKPLTGAFYKGLPPLVAKNTPFYMEKMVPPNLHYTMRDWAAPALPAEIANVGTLECSTFPGLHSLFRDKDGRMPGIGARGRTEPEYRGEAYTASGVGKATVVEWSPNRVVVDVDGATPGDRIVLNQNWDAGWTVDGQSAQNQADAVAGVVTAPQARVVFRYRPRTWWAACAIFSLTVAAIGFAEWTRRRRRFE
jgi:hypothetical protein